MAIALVVTLGAWACVEITLGVRDLIRGKGSTARDRGTRSTLVLSWTAALILATWLAGNPKSWQLVTGLLLMWAGLALRIWAVQALGPSFRTTVEVDADQRLVDTGPYRFVRHPSYTGVLLLAIGYGITANNWLALVIVLVVPLATMLRRISVEEATMADVLGAPYQAYQQRTKRLLPGLW